jgi:phosphosulfolactate synthase (CoM biosynthesis protein A)
LEELQNRRDFFPSTDNVIESVYFGGGTPSLIGVESLEKVLSIIAVNFSLSDSAEITIEANPDDLNPEYLSGLRSIGFNRISLGIQSFFDEDLAKDYADKLVTEGTNAYIIPPFGKSKFNRVAIEETESFAAASTRATELTGQFKEQPWPLKY